MRIIFNYLLVLILTSSVIAGCNKPDMNTQGPIEKDGIKPGVVTNVQVTNLPGAASITYTLPKDADLQYVLAEYSINSTTTRQAKTSRYSDTIQVDGFNKAGEYSVTLYAVDRSENRSEPVTVKVNPTTPPYRIIASSLQIAEDFGGVNVTFNNPDEGKIALVILTKDHNNEFVPVETFYTQIKDGSFSVRGYDTTERIFGAYIKDRWNNYSDTLFVTVTPMAEKILDKTKFRQYRLPDDQPSAWGWEMNYMWDGKFGEPGFHTLQGATPQPHRFTFDMGIVAKLSRFKIMQRPGGWLFAHGNPRKWTMWGTADTPNPDGSWNGWIKLRDCESIKPSGKPAGEITEEDKLQAMGVDGMGEEFVFPLSAPAVRYIRMEIHQNWSNTDFFHACEITFWGNPQ